MSNPVQAPNFNKLYVEPVLTVEEAMFNANIDGVAVTIIHYVINVLLIGIPALANLIIQKTRLKPLSDRFTDLVAGITSINEICEQHTLTSNNEEIKASTAELGKLYTEAIVIATTASAYDGTNVFLITIAANRTYQIPFVNALKACAKQGQVVSRQIDALNLTTA